MKLREADLKTAQETLAKTLGDRNAAARILGRTTRELAEIIDGDDQLAEWRTPGVVPSPIDEIKALERSAPLDLQAAEEALAEAARREDAAFAAGIGSMGLTADQVRLAVAHQRVSGMYFANMVSGMFGAMYATLLKCIKEQDLTSARLAQIRYELGEFEKYPFGSEAREQMVTEEQSLANQCRALGAEIIKVNDVGTKGALLMSVVRQGKKNAKKTARPTFKNATEV